MPIAHESFEAQAFRKMDAAPGVEHAEVWVQAGTDRFEIGFTGFARDLLHGIAQQVQCVALPLEVLDGLFVIKDGRFERKLDPAFMTARAGMDEAQLADIERETTRALWEALAKLSCPTLVVRGAASDILSPDCADRMVDEVLLDGRLAVVGRAAHSVMTDNPEGFEQALAGFLLSEE